MKLHDRIPRLDAAFVEDVAGAGPSSPVGPAGVERTKKSPTGPVNPRAPPKPESKKKGCKKIGKQKENVSKQ